MTHPPKRKRVNTPRQPAPLRLSREQQRAKAKAEMARAHMHLAEAERIAAGHDAPNAAAHAAYYAMHHCAIGVLLGNGGVDKFGDVPGSHRHVVEHFAKLVEPQAVSIKQLGPMIARAQSDRIRADYDLVRSVTVQEAVDAARDARNFVEICEAQLLAGQAD